MTAEQKQKRSIIFNNAYKLFNTIGIFSILFTIGVAKEEIRTHSFDTITDKVNTVNHVNKALSEVEIHDLKEHIHNPDYHMPKNQKDSIYVLRSEYNELVDRLSITNYQTKEQLREMTGLIRAINKKLDK